MPYLFASRQEIWKKPYPPANASYSLRTLCNIKAAVTKTGESAVKGIKGESPLTGYLLSVNAFPITLR